MQALKRVLSQMIGCGPHRVRAFPQVIEARRDASRGVHQPESFDGIIYQEAGDSAVYAPGDSLLDQAPQFESIAGRTRYLPTGIAPRVDKTLYSLSAAGLIGTDGVVYCPRTRQAVAETMRCWFTPIDRHPALAAPRLPPAKKVPGCTLNLALLSAEGFYHFLIEALPRLWLARSYLHNVDTVVANGTPGSFHESWLARAGIDRAQICWAHGHSHFICEQLLFTNYLQADYQPTPWMVDALRRLLNAHPPVNRGTRRLWISRSDATSRMLQWEDALLARLPKFERVLLGALPPGEQIDLMQQAEIVAGPHGAGLSNLVFCAPGTRVFELFPDSHRQPIYARLANVCNLAYAWAIVDFQADAACAPLADAIQRRITGDQP